MRSKLLWASPILVCCFFFVGIAYAQKNPISVIKETIQVGGADVTSRTKITDAEKKCRLTKVRQHHYKIEFNTLQGNTCLLKIPLSHRGHVNLKKSAALAFRIRGQKDVHHFNVGMEANNEIEYVGPIFEYLPLSVIKVWKQTGIPIREFADKGLDITRAQNLIFEFKEPAQGIVELKDVSFIPRKPNSENWEPVVVMLKEYGMHRMKDFKTISIGHYGQEFGWKIGRMYSTPPAHNIAARNKGKINISRLKSKTPKIENGIAMIADFNDGLQNHTNGYFNEFQRAPSTAFVTVSKKHFRGKSGASLKIKFNKSSGGFCGAWLHFFDFKKPPLNRVYFNAKPFKYLSFWIRGETGKENASIQMADASWESIEDSVYFGNLKDFLPKGVTTEWQEVRIPLRQLFYKNLKFHKLAGMTLNFRQYGKGTVYIDDIAFLTSKKAKVKPRSVASKAHKPKPKKLYKAMWLWHTTRQLKSKKMQRELFEFCKKQGVNLIFFQMQYNLEKQKDGSYICYLKHEKELRKFIENATKNGVEIHALDGFSRFALRPWHDKVLAQIRAIIAYNKRVPKRQRFTGIHHDNEPYLIPAYWGNIRSEVMAQYLRLCEESQRLVDASGLENFVFGVDIPFWYEELNFDFDVPVVINWKGVKKSASYHIIDLVDNVGIMDYRTKAYGADGTIVHGRDEIYYANKVGKNIFVGFETYPLPHEIFAVFRHTHLAYLTELAEKIRQNTRQLFMFTDQYQDLGILYLRRFRDDLKDTPQKIAREIHRLKINDGHRIYKSDIGVDVPSAKLSFAGMDKKYFTDIYNDTVNYFINEPGFYGTAIHYYETYKELMEN